MKTFTSCLVAGVVALVLGQATSSRALSDDKDVPREGAKAERDDEGRRASALEEMQARIQKLDERIREAHAKGNREAVQRLEIELYELNQRMQQLRVGEDTARGDQPRGDAPRSRGNERLNHLRTALNHLREAGANDLAEQVRAEIQRAEREVGQRDKPRDEAPDRSEADRDRNRD